MKRMTPDYVIENEAKNLLTEIGMPAGNYGYQYAAKAVVLGAIDRTIMDDMTHRLYPAVAKAFETAPPRVERAIRHAIEQAWTRADADTLYQFFGNAVSPDAGKPANGDFLARMADVLAFRIKQLEAPWRGKELESFRATSEEDRREFLELWHLYRVEKARNAREASA